MTRPGSSSARREARSRQHGAAADHLDVERSYERAVDALVGDRLQYVLVDGHDDVAAAFRLLSEQNAGRCGFVVLDATASAPAEPALPLVVPPGARALSSVVRTVGPHARAVERLIDRALICRLRRCRPRVVGRRFSAGRGPHGRSVSGGVAR